jgi:hypothetical protein
MSRRREFAGKDMHRWSQSRSRLRVENGVKGRFGERPFFFSEEHDPEKPAA